MVIVFSLLFYLKSFHFSAGDIGKKKAFQIRCGNVDSSNNVKVKPSKESIQKSSKRKQANANENQDNLEDEPPQKKRVAGSTKPKAAPSKTSSKTVAMNKLIVGQAKLTSFFRV